MSKLDLHGTRHGNVDRLVENYILCNQEDVPLTIVCGNSKRMIDLVVTVANRIGCDSIDYSDYGKVMINKI